MTSIKLLIQLREKYSFEHIHAQLHVWGGYNYVGGCFKVEPLSLKGKNLADVVFGRQQRLMPTAYKPAIMWVFLKKTKRPSFLSILPPT